MDLDSAIAAIDTAVAAGERSPALATLARAAHTSPAAFRESFLARVGLTPKAYADEVRAQRLRDSLASGEPVAEALFASGYGSTSRVYERHDDLLGMTPATYRKGAPGETIRYAFAESSLGRVIVGLTEAGVCFVAFGADDNDLLGDLAARFPRAEIAPARPDDAELAAAVVALVDDPAHAPDLPLDVRGTAFQRRVWRALTQIEPGETVTYSELARRIGSPSAVRAVAQACGANPVAVAVPCHRVIGSDGSLTGYRWGVERKRELLAREHR
jgi:AraC family transcriptional regulator of adaptative response/methylated-DNA-[protein]-cysteine methyltransferase